MKNLKIKILRIVIGLNQGGVQQAVLNLAQNLDNNKFELIVCAIENGGLIKWRTGLNPQPTPFNRPNWPMGFSGAPEIGELIYGGMKAVGMVLSVILV